MSKTAKNGPSTDVPVTTGEAPGSTPPPVEAVNPPAHWRPWAQFDSLRGEMYEAMSDFLTRWPGLPNASRWLRSEGPMMPALNVYKEKDNLVVEAALPGVDKKDVNIRATTSTLTIYGETKSEKKEQKEKEFHSELHYGSFNRSLTLPAEVDPDKVSAQLRDGILKVTLPLLEPERHLGKKIDIE